LNSIVRSELERTNRFGRTGYPFESGAGLVSRPASSAKDCDDGHAAFSELCAAVSGVPLANPCPATRDCASRRSGPDGGRPDSNGYPAWAIGQAGSATQKGRRRRNGRGARVGPQVVKAVVRRPVAERAPRRERGCATRRHMTEWDERDPPPAAAIGRLKLRGSRRPEVWWMVGAAPDDRATVCRQRAGCGSEAERRRGRTSVRSPETRHQPRSWRLWAAGVLGPVPCSGPSHRSGCSGGWGRVE
jgi:hypothetical protein